MTLNYITVWRQRTSRSSKDMATNAECASGPVVICDEDDITYNPEDFEDVETVRRF